MIPRATFDYSISRTTVEECFRRAGSYDGLRLSKARNVRRYDLINTRNEMVISGSLQAVAAYLRGRSDEPWLSAHLTRWQREIIRVAASGRVPS